MKKKGLGRGMDAIFLDNTMEDNGTITTLRLSDIEPRSGQPRKNFNAESLSQLADSIAANGLLQPIVVRVQDGVELYQIIAGERRWRAAKLAGLTEVPVMVVEADDKKAAEYALIENIQREDLSPTEEARGLQSLINDYHLTQEQVAKQVGKSRSAVTNALRLLELPENVLSRLEDKSLTAGHARALLGLNDKDKISEAADTVIAKELSVRAVEELVKRMNAAPTVKEEKSAEEVMQANYYHSLEEKITASLGLKVKINGGKRRRSVMISYRTADELESILSKLV